MKGQTNMLSNKRGCPRRTNVGLDRVSIVPLDWSMDGTSKQRLMHEHVGKHAKRMHRSKESQTGGTNQAWQATLHGEEKGMHQANRNHGDASHKWLHPNRP